MGLQDYETIKLCHLLIFELPARSVFSMWMCTLKWRHAVVQACVVLAEGEQVLCLFQAGSWSKISFSSLFIKRNKTPAA